MLNGLDLFSGYGGITLGLSKWVRPIAYCENERYAQGILLSRMAEGKLPIAPIWDDVTTLNGSIFREQVDIIYGGFPCQDISVAGIGNGLAGKRSGLFFEVCRLVKEIKPTFVFLENVPAIRTRGLREVVREFTDLGYDCRWTRVSASEVGANHRRQRWFLLAHATSNNDKRALRTIFKENATKQKPQCQHENEARKFSNASKHTEVLANPNGEGLQRHSETETPRQTRLFKIADGSLQKGGSTYSWEVEPNVGRVVNGCPARMDRIKALGNGVVPLQVKTAFEKLLGMIS